jgi:MFS family permease
MSIYIRLKLNESPLFKAMKEQGKGSKAPLAESFGQWSNLKIVILALLGATAGQGVVWYTGQFYALFFLGSTLKVPYETVYGLIAFSLVLGTPFFIVFGRLSDRIGRKWIMMLGCLLGVLTYFPLYRAMTHYANPALEHFQASTKVTLTATDCQVHIFALPTTRYSDCDKVRNLLTSRSLNYEQVDGPAGSAPVVKVNDTEITGVNEPKLKEALAAAGYPAKFDFTGFSWNGSNAGNWWAVLIILFIQVIYVTMVYGPIAAYLVELFPTRIRYTSMSLPYHIGNGWFGGMLPLTATALVAANGNIYYGLWYPVIVASMTFIIGSIFVRETKDHKIGVL